MEQNEHNLAHSLAAKLRHVYPYITHTYVYAKDTEEGGGHYFLALVKKDEEVDLVPKFWNGYEVRTRLKGVTVSAELREDQIDWLQEVAKKRGVSASELLRELIDMKMCLE